MLATVLVMCSSVQAFATPTASEEVIKGREKYAEIQSKITSIQTKIDELNAKMEPLQSTITENEKEQERIKNVIDNTGKEIEQCKKEITELDTSLGERVSAMYKAGNMEFNYLTFLLESDSTSDFFTRISTLSSIVGKDKKSIEDVTTKKKELNEKVESLKDKKEEVEKLTEKVKTDLEDLDSKKVQQEELGKQAQEEAKKFDAEELSALERDQVKAQIDVINNSNSTSEQIQSAITQLRSIRDEQLKSEIVKAEADEAIEKGKPLVEQKKEQEAQAKAQESASSSNANRGGGTSSSTKPSSTSSSKKPSAGTSGSASAVLNEAYKHLGKAYVYGATGPSNFDCSGFTEYVYLHATGRDISRTTYTQIGEGTPVSQADLQPGDLVFPNDGHVGIYVGNGQMIHAPHTGDVVKVGPVYSFYAARRIL